MEKYPETIVLTPSTDCLGGIANYYNVLKPYFHQNVKYFTRGARTQPFKGPKVKYIIIMLGDYFKFIEILIMRKARLIVINTSIGVSGLVRDAIYLIIAIIFNKRVILFFRGIDDNILNEIEHNYLSIFRSIFFRSDSIIVLSTDFQKMLTKWGYQKKIYVETTVVDDNIYRSNASFLNDKSKTILFLARLERDKGVFEAIKTLQICRNLHNDIRIIIAGEGTIYKEVSNYVQSNNIEGVTFIGYVKGDRKSEAFHKSAIYLFPSTHSEGMPNSVLEAMAYGLPVITSSVGGIRDFFENGKMGFIVSSNNPEDYAKKVLEILNSSVLREEISTYNYKYAKNHFIASVVSKRLEQVFIDSCYGKY